MDQDVQRLSSTSGLASGGVMPAPRSSQSLMFEPRPSPPASVLPDYQSDRDKERTPIDALLRLESSKILDDMNQSADKSSEQLNSLVEKAKRDSMGIRFESADKPYTNAFPTPMPTIKPQDIVASRMADQAVYGSTFNKRALLPVQGGKVGINWSRQLRPY